MRWVLHRGAPGFPCRNELMQRPCVPPFGDNVERFATVLRNNVLDSASHSCGKAQTSSQARGTPQRLHRMFNVEHSHGYQSMLLSPTLSTRQRASQSGSVEESPRFLSWHREWIEIDL